MRLINAFLISYRASRTYNDACHCHPEWQTDESSLTIRKVSDLDEAAEFIAARISEYPDNDFAHLLVFSLKDLDLGEIATYARTASIDVPDDAGGLIRGELAARVDDILKAREEAKKAAEKAAKEREQAVTKAAQRRQDLAELARIQKRLEENS